MRRFCPWWLLAWIRQQGKPVFEPVTWVDTLAENRNGNNHVLHSVLSRLSLGVWRPCGGTRGREFSERWVRMPSYLAGLGADLTARADWAGSLA